MRAILIAHENLFTMLAAAVLYMVLLCRIDHFGLYISLVLICTFLFYLLAVKDWG